MKRFYVVRYHHRYTKAKVHHPYSTLEQAVMFVKNNFSHSEIESENTELTIEYCGYANEIDLRNDFTCGNYYPIWSGYIQGADSLDKLESSTRTKGL